MMLLHHDGCRQATASNVRRYRPGGDMLPLSLAWICVFRAQVDRIGLGTGCCRFIAPQLMCVII